MGQAKISIIVPIYKVEPYLEQCIRSLIEQTYKDIEIFLVDDGSPDRCGEICDAFAAKDERIRVIHQKNMGVSVARNAGLEVASGEYVMFVDGDDWVENDCCEKALKAAEEQGCDVVCFREEVNDDAGAPVRRRPSNGSFSMDREMLCRLQKRVIAETSNWESDGFPNLCTWAKLYRRRVVTDNGCSFPVGIKRRQDIIFNIYCLEHIRSAYCLDYIGYHYRLSPESICRRYNPEMIDILLSGMYVISNFINEKHAGEEDYERALGVCSIRIERAIRNTMFFHRDGHMPYKEYLTQMRRYCEAPIIVKYIEKCRLSDFETIRDKIKYLLISNKQYFLYYCVYDVWHRIKLCLNVR